MQRSKVEKLKLVWGDKPCNHPKIQKEYEQKNLTGNIICLQCGRTIYNSAKQPFIIGLEIQKEILKATTSNVHNGIQKSAAAPEGLGE